MTNPEIATVLTEIADLLEFQGANPFRIRAYRTAARTVEDLATPIRSLLAEPDADLTQVKGIGKDLAEKIAQLVETGSIPMLEELLAEIPEGALDMLRIPGLGPKKAATLYRELGITSLDELRSACEEQRVRALKGFGAKTEEAILHGIEIAAQAALRMLWIEAHGIAQDLLAKLRAACPSIKRLEAAGSYRRGRDTVGDLDLLAVSDDANAVMNAFEELADVDAVLVRGETKMSIRRRGSQFQVDLRVVPEESFGAALQYFTGSQAHNVELRSLAKKRGLKINEYGVFKGEKRVAGREEADVYAALKLPCFSPEMREGRWEFEWAEQGELPRLIELSDIRGDLHMHSTWTDGRETIEEMALAAKARGLEYIAMTDHSKRVTVAGGLDEKALLRQWDDIDRLNETLDGITVLKGVEVDILEKGGLDIRDDVLEQADWVIASVHFGQRQSRDKITARVLDALRNPYVCAFGHPTGRLLNERPAYEIDMEAVFETARAEGKILELNASPFRLDLDDVACGMARQKGVPVAISSDAHYAEGLDVMPLGVQQARRGGLGPRHVVNTMPLEEFLGFLKKLRSGR